MTTPYYSDDSITLHHGDSLAVLRDYLDLSLRTRFAQPGLDLLGGEGA